MGGGSSGLCIDLKEGRKLSKKWKGNTDDSHGIDGHTERGLYIQNS